ncbi:peptidylprolyl isomerase [Candidatus Uabimicrobium amorphum]|uniref:Peptidyl-prolyl cis-trans isomerase n=1 Tax=Uabimicrobium amorphum TaxID=2596890 RepID=A0A5S9F2Y4_UABAM|nr:peptidylprolyl isomerase [Candidatus Uabimicrobium amorphum]BBM83701.1 peptidyl-prolyl cis-trans isomerase [Candidatus Uabimicrobium amorphum]
MATKDVTETPEKTQSWAEKINENRSTYMVLGGVILAVVLISFWYTNNLKRKSQRAWALVGAVSSAMSNAQVSDTSLKVEDLNIDAHKLVQQKLGSLESIPQFFRNEATSIDDLHVRKLPEDLRRTVLLKHYKVALQDEIKKSKNTSAAPFLYYWLGNIYFQERNVAEAAKWYEKVINRYPNHFLSAEAEKDMLAANKDQTWLDKQTYDNIENLDDFEANSKTSVQVTTSKGKFTIQLFDKNSKAIENFMSLVNSGYYNGLSFYGISPEKISGGCSLGNGRSEIGKVQAEFQDVYVQRGLVILEQVGNKFGEVCSRISITKKYPYFRGLQRCTILGVISEEDMAIVDSLTGVDVILGVSAKEVSN